MKKRGSVPLFVLAKLNKRAETTDTILYYVSDLRSDLEEMLLSIYEEVLTVVDISNPKVKETVNEYMNSFNIVEVKYIGLGG